MSADRVNLDRLRRQVMSNQEAAAVADELDGYRREAAAAEGYDSPAETHRRLTKTLELIGAGLDDEDADRQNLLEDTEMRLANIIRDMPVKPVAREARRG